MRTNIQTLFDEFKLHTHDDYVFRGFSGRIRQLIIQGVDTPTKAAWVAEFINELTARMRKCEYTVILRPEPWFPQVPSHIKYGIYVVVNQGVVPVDDLYQSGLAEWHAFEDRQFATATAFLALSSDRPTERPTCEGPTESSTTPIPTTESPAATSSMTPRTSVGKMLCWNGRSVTCFNASIWRVMDLNTSYLTECVDFAWMCNGEFIPLASIKLCKDGLIVCIDGPVPIGPFPVKDNQHITMCIAGTLEPALCDQLPPYKFDLYEHTVGNVDMLVNNTDDNIVVCRDNLTGYYYTAEPGRRIEPLNGKVVCSEPVLQFA
jgi:hypothetical protein